MKFRALSLLATAIFSFGAMSGAAFAADSDTAKIRRTVDETIRPLMALNGIAGMAVGVVVDGRPYVFDYGVASKATKQPVTRDTLFELGSVSKTFTATLASYAQIEGDLSLNDPVSKHLPSLDGTRVRQGDAVESRHAHAGRSAAASARRGSRQCATDAVLQDVASGSAARHDPHVCESGHRHARA